MSDINDSIWVHPYESGISMFADATINLDFNTMEEWPVTALVEVRDVAHLDLLIGRLKLGAMDYEEKHNEEESSVTLHVSNYPIIFVFYY